MKTYYISFDDTDNLTSPGTGHVLTAYLKTLPCKASFISRHQLFVSCDVPYTSHNSSMCSVLTGETDMDTLVKSAGEYLEQTLAPGADPGLCVADADSIQSPEKLVQWGFRAKKEVLTKEEAYALAEACGVHLSEHGGTGQGVVGALAAVGLRLSGQDGRVKGKKTVLKDRMTVSELLAETGFERVCAYGAGELPADAELILSSNQVKAVYQNFQSTVLAAKKDGAYYVLDKDAIKCY